MMNRHAIVFLLCLGAAAACLVVRAARADGSSDGNEAYPSPQDMATAEAANPPMLSAQQLRQRDMIMTGVADTIDCLVEAEKSFIMTGNGPDTVVAASVQLCGGHLTARTSGTIPNDVALKAVDRMARDVLRNVYSQ